MNSSARERVLSVLHGAIHWPIELLVKKIILDNLRITIRKIADGFGISFGSHQAIFTDVLGMKRVAVKIVPKLLNFEQNQCRMNIAQEMLTAFNDDPDLLKNG